MPLLRSRALPGHGTRPATVVAVLVTAALLGLSACSGTTGDTGETASAKPVVEKDGPAGPVPDGMGEFYGQALTWGPCKPYAKSANARRAFRNTDLRCARLRVPLDYDKPDGEAISLGLLRKKAAPGGDVVGSLLVNPGGPGESGMVAAAGLTPKFMHTPLAKHFDFVGFDPRGVGASQPQVDCLTDQEQDERRTKDFDVDTSPSGIAKAMAKEREYAQQCVRRTEHGKAMLANVGSRTVAKDMDVLRSALGDRKLNYVGFSYGTRIGTAYAEQFPKNVRAMVLDGAVDPDQGSVDEVVSQAKGFQNAFDSFAQWCAEQQSCALGKDPSRAVAAYHQLTRPLIDRPLTLGNGRVLGYDEAKTGTQQALYSKSLWKVLAKALTGLKQGDGSTLLALADMYMGRGPKGHYSTTQDVFTAVRCVDDPPVTDKQTLIEEQRRFKQVAPFLDDGKPAVAEKEACAFWPVPPTGKPHTPKVSGLAPTLVISTTHDPATPYEAGVKLAEALHGGLLTKEGTQHTAFLQDDDCIDHAASHYLVTGELPPEGKRCS